jgi:hypothetical protein
MVGRSLSRSRGIAQLVELAADANIPEPKMEKRVPG